MNNYKFFSRKLPALKVNFRVKNPTGDLYDSILPIEFKSIIMYDHPEYRGKLSQRMLLLKREFYHLMHHQTDFSLHCSNMLGFFDFLSFYDGQVEKANFIVSKFMEIIRVNGAIIEGDLNDS